MAARVKDRLFASIDFVVDHVLGLRNYRSKSSALELAARGMDVDAATLVPALLQQLECNWKLALAELRSPSTQNFRWRFPQTGLREGNPSEEVSIERELIRALETAGRDDWSNQVPLISGLGGPTAHKRRAVDLVHKINDGAFEFVELKIDSDTPLYAAVEVLTYGLLWLLSRRDRMRLGYSDTPILNAQSLRLSVLAPANYYSAYRLPSLYSLCTVINEGLKSVGPSYGVDMDFRFTRFPSTFYWSSDRSDILRPVGPNLIALLDGRKGL